MYLTLVSLFPLVAAMDRDELEFRLMEVQGFNINQEETLDDAIMWVPGPRLNIKNIFPGRKSRYKDETVVRPLHILYWEKLYW